MLGPKPCRTPGTRGTNCSGPQFCGDLRAPTVTTAYSTGYGLLEGQNVRQNFAQPEAPLTCSPWVIELEHAVVQALHRIRILRYDARPISKLPPEILIPIFDFAIPPSEDTESTYAFKNFISLIHVCRHWRSIILNHCRAWSNVHLKDQDYSRWRTRRMHHLTSQFAPSAGIQTPGTAHSIFSRHP